MRGELMKTFQTRVGRGSIVIVPSFPGEQQA